MLEIPVLPGKIGFLWLLGLDSKEFRSKLKRKLENNFIRLLKKNNMASKKTITTVRRRKMGRKLYYLTLVMEVEK